MSDTATAIVAIVGSLLIAVGLIGICIVLDRRWR